MGDLYLPGSFVRRAEGPPKVFPEGRVQLIFLAVITLQEHPQTDHLGKEIEGGRHERQR